MIQTLRITGVAAVAFAGVVLASVLGPVSLIQYGVTGDERMGRVLAAPGAVERFHELHDGKGPAPDAIPPLVEQARIFKDIIDPRQLIAAAPVTTRQAATRNNPTIRPPETSPKFKLIGTSYSPSNPGSSFAYIFVDNAFKWVQCGEDLGYLVIKEVKADSVVCWDGNSEREILREIVPDRVSLLETDSPEQASAAPIAPQRVEVKVTETLPIRPPLSNRSLRPQPQPQRVVPRPADKMADDEKEAYDDLLNRLKMLQGSSGDANSPTDAEQVAAASRLISEFKSSQVSPRETRQLEDLGREPNDGAASVPDEKMQELIKRLNAGRASQP